MAKASESGETTMTVRVPAIIRAAMERHQDTHGVPFSEQVRRALREWLIKQGALAPEQTEGK
jgi:hypothetical protein